MIGSRVVRLAARLLALSQLLGGCRDEPKDANVSRPPSRPFDRVVVVSIDGLRPSDCQRTETLRKISSEGAFARPPEGVLGVTPSVTYPSHTSMMTGVYPARHGITSNLAPDSSPEQQNENGWRWYDEDIRVDTVYSVAHREGLRTALISWPVTVGAKATLRLPEFWRAGTPDDVKLARALSTPGFLAEVEKRDRTFVESFRPPKVPDQPLMSAALTALELAKPELLLLHIFALDGTEHRFGPDSEQARKAVETADRQLTRLLRALEKTPEWPRTALFVVSDHGFAKIEKNVQLRAHLDAAELATRVWTLSSGGFAYFYLTDPEDTEAATLTRSLMDRLSEDPEQGIGQRFDRAAISDLHGDPDAFMAIEATPSFAFSKSSGSSAVTPSGNRGAHGYLPQRMEMRASLIVYGPRIAPQALVDAKLVDLAPTIAAMLGLHLPNTDGRALELSLR